jgi:acetyl esterase/lipase
MKKIFLLLFTAGLIIQLDAQQWGTKVDYDIATKYDVYTESYSYSDPFLVTDIRAGTRYEFVESYNIKNLIVYRPFDSDHFLSKRPVIFFIHGGEWIDGYAEWYQFVSQSLTAEEGWVLVTANYCLTSDSLFIADEYCPDREHCSDSAHRTKAAWYPDNIRDVKDAFRWVKQSIDTLSGDTNNIFIFGHSAGGHLVSLFAVSGDYAALRPDIRGVISLSGAYHLKDLDMFVFGDCIDLTFRGGHENNDAELNEASPLNYITSGLSLPPFQLLHCSIDLPSLPEQKILFGNTLDFYGYYNENVYLDNYTHVTEMTALEDIDSEPTQRIIQFVQGHLYPTGIAENSENSDKLLENPAPNPASSKVKVTFRLKQSGEVQFSISDITGKCIEKLPLLHETEGLHTIEFDVSFLKTGIYFLKLQTGNSQNVRKLVVN